MALDHLGRFDFRSSSDCWLNGCGKDEQLVVAVESSHEPEVLTLEQYGLRFGWVDGESDANVGRSKMVRSGSPNGFAHVHGQP